MAKELFCEAKKPEEIFPVYDAICSRRLMWKSEMLAKNTEIVDININDYLTETYSLYNTLVLRIKESGGDLYNKVCAYWLGRAEKGDPEAYYRCKMLIDSTDVDYLDEAVNRGHKFAKVLDAFATCIVSGGKYTKDAHVRILEEAYENGWSDAAIILADIYHDKIEGGIYSGAQYQNLKIKYNEIGALRGNDICKFRSACYYEEGDGVGINVKKALSYYMDVINSNNPSEKAYAPSMVKVAIMYAQEVEILDLREAIYWLERCRDTGWMVEETTNLIKEFELML